MIDLDVNKHEQNDFINFWSKYADKVAITELYVWPWSGQNGFFPAPCPKIREDMFFYTDGTAVLCCWDAFGRSNLGNIKEQSLEEIWLGEINQQNRRYLNEGQRNKIKLCSRCDAFKKYDFSNWKGY